MILKLKHVGWNALKRQERGFKDKSQEIEINSKLRSLIQLVI